jgi:MFS family permease
MVAQEPVPVDTVAQDASTRDVRKVAFSGLLGTVIEYYDFLLYSTMAALVFGTVFFPAGDGSVSTVAAFGTLAAGYVARPLGGIVFGHFGDRLGRKSMLVLSMILMGVASVLIGVLPGYATIGVAAPILLVTLRAIQGVAVGGEYGGAALMVIEHASAKRRGAWVGIVLMGTPLGGLLATLAVTLATTTLPQDAFLSWGWRIPFLISALLLGIGLYVRLSVAESPVFQAAVDEADARKADAAPAVELLRKPGRLLLGCAAGIGPFALTALLSSHMIAYAGQLGYAIPSVMQLMLIITAVSLVAIPAFAALSDRIGRRRMVLIGAVGAILYAFPLYAAVTSGSFLLLALGMVGGQILQNMMFSPLAPLLSEMFSTRVRYSGVSIAYQTASLIGAGFTPMIAAALVAATDGSSVPLSIIVIVGAVLTLVAVLTVGETRGRDLTAQGGDT